MDLGEEPKVKEPKTRPLDAYVDKLSDYREAQKMIAFWKGRLEDIKAELAGVMKDSEVGTVDGKPVLFYEYQERFQGAEFKKAMPDTARFFTREVVHKELDVDWLRQSRPDLYEQFKVRAMRNTFDA